MALGLGTVETPAPLLLSEEAWGLVQVERPQEGARACLTHSRSLLLHGAVPLEGRNVFVRLANDRGHAGL